MHAFRVVYIKGLVNAVIGNLESAKFPLSGNATNQELGNRFGDAKREHLCYQRCPC
jgi:hypothetical protein